MKQMPNIWLDSILTFDDTIIKLEECLSVLLENAETADFVNPNIRKQYSNDVIYMKQFFEKAESIARGNDGI